MSRRVLVSQFAFSLSCAATEFAFALEHTTGEAELRRLARAFLRALAEYQARHAAALPRAEHIEFAQQWIAGRDGGQRLRARFPALRDHINAEHRHRFEFAHELEREWIAAQNDQGIAERLRIAGAIVAFVAEHTEPVARSVAEHADAVQFAAAILEESSSTTKERK